MRASILLRCGAVLLPLGLSSLAQSTIPSSTAILARANQAFSAGKPVASVEMTGTAQWFAGSAKDGGPVKLTAKTTGENSIELDLSNGTRIETQSAVTDDRTCSWSGKDGVSHDMASPNRWVRSAYAPAITEPRKAPTPHCPLATDLRCGCGQRPYYFAQLDHDLALHC